MVLPEIVPSRRNNKVRLGGHVRMPRVNERLQGGRGGAIPLGTRRKEAAVLSWALEPNHLTPAARIVAVVALYVRTVRRAKWVRRALARTRARLDVPKRRVGHLVAQI